jgi:hypothetical protein
LQVVSPGQRCQQVKALTCGGSGEQRNLGIDSSGPLDFNQVWPAGSEHPDDLSTVAGTPHFFGDHRVDATGEPGVVLSGIALAERLVGFVDEDIIAAKRLSRRKIFSRLPSVLPHPFIVKVF